MHESEPTHRISDWAQHLGAHKILLAEKQIQTRIHELGQEIGRDYQHKKPLLVGILNGSVIFLSDLVRAMDIPLEMDFMSVSSYGNDTKSSGVVRLIKDLNRSIEGRHVIIVEDIIDSGLTMEYLRNNLATRGPASLEVCSLLVKPSNNNANVKYVGFSCPDDFVVGYGLDYAGTFRNLPYIAACRPPA